MVILRFISAVIVLIMAAMMVVINAVMAGMSLEHRDGELAALYFMVNCMVYVLVGLVMLGGL